MSAMLAIANSAFAADAKADDWRKRRDERAAQLAKASAKWVAKLVGTESNHAVIGEPTQVRAWLLRPQESGPFPARAEDYPILEGPVVLSPQLATNASRILLATDSYAWAKKKMCLINYGVRLEFVRGVDSMNVLLCFDCEELRFFGGGSENFDPARPALATLVMTAFPTHPRAKNLKTDPLTASQIAGLNNPDFVSDKKLRWYLELEQP
ncbi:MAG: hypothetical protein HY301_07810 [Verrucomicrobia bacterium]|nr:hypothetical protein [Verrucomicrobiota bacterium]